MSKEPNRYQLSSRLAYQSHTPAFLQRLQRKVGGGDDDEEDDEFEYDGSGRPPIPRRPSIPERPDGDPGSADEDDADEAPQIVVLKEGRHLSAREVENEKRKGSMLTRNLVSRTLCTDISLLAKGLSPLPDSEDPPAESVEDITTSPKQRSKEHQNSDSLTFSSSSSTSKPSLSKKRKIVTSEDAEESSEVKHKGKHPKKRPKKADKKLLSFDM